MSQKFYTILCILALAACNSSQNAPAGATDHNAGTTTVNNAPTKTGAAAPKANSVKAYFASQGKDALTMGGAQGEQQTAIENSMAKIAGKTDGLIGYWVGVFGEDGKKNNKINIALSEVDVKAGKASGHSVCAGNYRAIKGTVKETSNQMYIFELKEPGDDKYDGQFRFTIDTKKQELTGSWAPFKTEVIEEKRNYTLTKKQFQYNATVGKYNYTSQRLLEEDELLEYSSDELRIMRNEIYARHGYSFKNKDIRQHFDQQDWYIPMAVDVRDQLSEIEIKNIDMIYNYEEYISENYDSYGR